MDRLKRRNKQMSFNQTDKSSKVYAPGYFLAYNDEGITRETREVAQNSALVVTTNAGGKYVPMGTAYPTNDGNAIGILYEDVDVTTGNMPGSVVTKGVVYEDRLAVTGESYDAVTPAGTENPSEEGWYERSGSAGAYVYTLTDDTTVQVGTTYYAKSDIRLASAAKSALAALGFKFIAAEPAVTRPY
jgi:hypothetical protein